MSRKKSTGPEQEKRSKGKNEEAGKAQQAAKQLTSSQLPLNPVDSADKATIQAQSAQLRDSRFQTAQRQAMATQIGQVGGNKFLQQVVTHSDQDPSVIQQKLGSGQSLGGTTKSRMESAFGRDFSEVRVHTGDDAAQAARGLNARAFSIGSNIAFDEGEYQPGSLIGEALLAHELAHVAQQDGATPEPMKNIPTEDSAIELDADKSAINAVLSLWSAGKTTLANISRNAMPTLRSGLGLRRCVKATKTNDAAVKLLSDSYGKYKKISGGSVEVLEQKDFEKKYDEIYGATQYSWSKYVVPKFGNLEGFAHGGINYINKDKMSIDTVPHEMLHNNADPGWKGFAGSNINEGVTEYLTIKAVTAAGQTPTHSYPNQEGVIQVLVATVGEDKIMKAYFNGEIEALKKEVDSKCKGSWDAFKAAMDKDEWLKAKGLAKSK